MKKTVEISLLGLGFLWYSARIALVHYSNMNSSWFDLWILFVYNHFEWFLVLLSLKQGWAHVEL